MSPSPAHESLRAERPQAAAPAPLAWQPSAVGLLAATWGLVGTLALLSRAIWRLTPAAWEAVTRFQPGVLGWSFGALWLCFMGYTEGYRGFQLGFAPRVARRAAHLARHPRPLHVLLAPLFCMGLIHASRRRLLTSWALVSMVVVLVLTVRHLPQPWRGLVDAGVVLGLTWGVGAVLVFGVRALRGRAPHGPVDLPAGVAG